MENKTSIKITIIGNSFLVECTKVLGTSLADYLMSNNIWVSEVRFPLNIMEANIYGKINPDIDIEELVNSYSKEHGYN